jgi:hypothetical protein
MNGGIIENKGKFMNKFSFFNVRQNFNPDFRVFHRSSSYFNNDNLFNSEGVKKIETFDRYFDIEFFTVPIEINEIFQSGEIDGFGNAKFTGGDLLIEGFIDINGSLTGSIGRNVFWRQQNMKVIIAPNITTLEIALFGRTNTGNILPMTTLRLESLEQMGSRSLFIVPDHKITRIYFPRLIDGSAGFNRFGKLNQITIYVSDNLINDTTFIPTWQSLFKDVVFVNENDIEIIPSAQSIGISNITSNSVDISILDSTENYSFPIDFYQIYAYDGNELNKYHVHQEVTTNTATITGLESNTSYKILVKVADTIYNLSEHTESNQFTTL